MSYVSFIRYLQLRLEVTDKWKTWRYCDIVDLICKENDDADRVFIYLAQPSSNNFVLEDMQNYGVCEGKISWKEAMNVVNI